MNHLFSSLEKIFSFSRSILDPAIEGNPYPEDAMVSKRKPDSEKYRAPLFRRKFALR